MKITESLILKIFKELDLLDFISYIEFEENKNMYYQKIIHVKLINTERFKIILNAYNKKEFEKNDYTNEIKEQILENKYLFTPENEEREAKIIFNKNGNGYLTTKITIPVPWVRDMDLNEENRNVKIEYFNKTITIKKA